MAKFIIEISDEQIRALHDTDKTKEQAENKKDPMRVLFDMMAGVIISKKLDEGVNEFHISREMMGDNERTRHLRGRHPDRRQGYARRGIPRRGKRICRSGQSRR